MLVSTEFLSKPAVLNQLLEVLVGCFAMDASGAALMLKHPGRAAGGTGASYTSTQQQHYEQQQGQHQLTQKQQQTQIYASRSNGDAKEGGGKAEIRSTIAAAGDGKERASSSLVRRVEAPLLPRMPLGTTFITSARCYDAVANVARTVGFLAAQNAGGVAGKRETLVPMVSLSCHPSVTAVSPEEMLDKSYKH